MTEKRTQIKLYAGIETAAKWDEICDGYNTNTTAFAVMVDWFYENRGSIPFNRACTLLGIDEQRERFSVWRQANDVPDEATLQEWRNYATQFETDGDDASEKATQRGSMI